MTNYLSKLTKLSCFFYGLLLPLSFAPFHIPGFAIISLGFFYYELNAITTTPSLFRGFKQGLAYGLGFFGLGTSWLYVSIHDYGHLSSVLSAFITLLFILYLALFPAGMALFYKYLRLRPYSLLSVIGFAALWTLSEYFRANFLTGFPWLLVGVGQIDAPIKELLPIVGIYGVSFLTCLAGGILILIFQQSRQKRIFPVIFLVLIILGPGILHQKTDPSKTLPPLSVGVIQANLSMRDKWDERLFWQLLKQHQKNIKQLLGTTLIVLPESAIPVPASYIQDILKQMSEEAKKAGSAILLGIPTSNFEDANFYNTLIALGQGHGSYLKQHLVPFGEYIPQPFHFITRKLNLPDVNMQSGDKNQKLIKIHHTLTVNNFLTKHDKTKPTESTGLSTSKKNKRQQHQKLNHGESIPIATLICYELAYSDLLRAQIPTAQFIVSISDDGWFGYSLAMYQHQQIAQVQSLQTGRYQVLANNDGLSSVIDAQGSLVQSLAPFTAGNLKANIVPRTNITLWVRFGDRPTVFFVSLISLFCLLLRFRKITSTNPLLPAKSREAILTGELKNNVFENNE